MIKIHLMVHNKNCKVTQLNIIINLYDKQKRT